MSSTYSIKDSFTENRVFLSRIVAIFIFSFLLTTGLVVRLVYLQVVGHEQYASLAKRNRIKLAPVPPTRGIIYDRKGKIIAENIPSYTLQLIPEQIKDLENTLLRLQNLLSIPDEIISQFHKLKNRQKRFSSIPLLLQMSDQQVAQFAVVRHSFPGVDIHAGLLRHYRYGNIASHAVGYLGRINEKELKSLPETEYRGTHQIGKTGIEKSYESILHGQTGYAQIETNAKGRAINTLDTDNPKPGSSLYLSLDIELQEIGYNALADYNGAIVAIDLASDGILAFVSNPGFDPNLFVTGISKTEYKALQDSDDQPLFNRALRGLYPPGSTIKPFIGLAGLEYKATEIQNKLFCPGFYRLPNINHNYRDWKRGGHGSVNLEDAIIQSCDVYFYDLALTLGIDRMHDFLQQFGFGEKTGIDLNGEKAGLLPSKQWKRGARNLPWYPGETLITGIGQGFTQVTALQLARATATLANRGKVSNPTLVDRIVDNNSTQTTEQQQSQILAFHPENIDHINKAMINVVHGARGTAKRIGKDIDYQIAGKTGTAQVFTVKQEEKYSEEEISFKLRDHALFIAFAPADNPQIAIAVIVENGGHGGSVAAPIASKIIKNYLSEPT